MFQIPVINFNSNVNNAAKPVLLAPANQKYLPKNTSSSVSNPVYINTTATFLNEADKKKYLVLLNALKDVKASSNSEGLTPNKQLEKLLRNGKLLQKSKNDKTTTLDNLYEIATQDRTSGLDNLTILLNTLDILSNPRIITQNFGDIPISERQQILNGLKKDDEVKQSPELMDVTASGTCAAASNEVNLADKYPAEFARWANHLSSPNKAVYLNVALEALSSNKLDAVMILNLLEAKIEEFSFDKVKIKVSPDNNAYIRAKIQNNNWDPGERNVVDVLIQSAIMQLGTQNTYNSLSDTRKGSFSSNSQGLIEIEKTFVESLIKGKETTSLVYHKIDDDENLVGYNCSPDKIEKHLKNTLDTGEDVILGYILTNETAGRTEMPDYDPSAHGAPNKVISGHEITVVDYKVDSNGKTNFVCVDTDDDNPNFVTYSADWLIPKIHHAGYPATIVAEDEKEILNNSLS